MAKGGIDIKNTWGNNAIAAALMALFIIAMVAPTAADTAQSSVTVIDAPTCVLDLHVPANKDPSTPVDLLPASLALTTTLPINVKFGDCNSQEDIVGPFIAKIFDSDQQLVLDNIPIDKLNPSTQNHNWVQGQGKAYLPYYLPEGDYYVFIYQIIDGVTIRLPFGCTECDLIKPCCENGHFTFCNSHENSCCRFWCCCCCGSGSEIRNKFHINGNMAIIAEDVDYGDIDPGSAGYDDITIINVGNIDINNLTISITDMNGSSTDDILSFWNISHDFDIDATIDGVQVDLPTGYVSQITGTFTINIPVGILSDTYTGTIGITPSK